MQLTRWKKLKKEESYDNKIWIKIEIHTVIGSEFIGQACNWLSSQFNSIKFLIKFYRSLNTGH